jgi:Flp pilus assembly protein TadD
MDARIAEAGEAHVAAWASERLAARDPWAAVGVLRAGLRSAFRDPDLHRLLGHACEQIDDPVAAADSYRRILAFGAEPRRVLPFLARSLSRSGRPREAVRAYCRHLRGHRGDAGALSGLGLALGDLGKLELAQAFTARATRVAPSWAGAHGNHGIVLYRRHALDEALAAFERAEALAPGDAVARYHVSLVHLTRGDYRRGFSGFDAHMRLWAPRFRGGVPPARPRAGQTLLVRAHNGLGDTLQFVRYVPRLAGLGARVVLAVQERLRPLLDGFPGTDEVIGWDDPVPAHDAALSLLEMPRVFEDTLDTIPAPGRYLHADPRRVARWSARLGEEGRLRVGLVWHGNPAQRDGLHRSCPLKELAALRDVEGVSFYSLQLGAGSEELAGCPELRVRDLSGDLDREGAFLDTAAVLESLDLLISVDTSVCHLAGALGRPVWLLLPDWADWRWLLGTARSPWYPTFRLFRQPRPFDWASVVRGVRAELRALAARP